MSIKTINPATNENIKSFEEMSAKGIDIALENSEKAF